MRRFTRVAWSAVLGAVLLATGALAQGNPGFTAANPATPFTATTGGVSATMPAGPAVVVSNTGANAAYCQQGPTATTSSQYIASGSWFEFAKINGQTQMTCITATSTTTVNMVGGVGQASGGGGGGSSGGATSNVSIVSPLGSQLKAASVSETPATVTWIAPTSASITSSGTVVAAGPAVSVITNATAAGGGTLTLNLFGGTAVANVGIPLQPGASVTVSGQPAGTAITGICSTGTCTVAVQSGT